MWSHLAAHLQSGNPYIISMFILGFIGLIILIERFIMLQFVYGIDFTTFLDSLRKSVQAEDIDRALQICKKTSHTSLPKISLKALDAAERDPSTVKGTIEEETILFLPNLENRLSILPTISTVILLLGILGTIDGLWSAFDSIVILDTAQKQARLSNGIAGSLNPTAAGLFLCMLFLSGNHLLKSMSLKILDQVHYGVTILNNLLVPHEVTAIGGPMMQASPMSAFDPAQNPVSSAEPAIAEEDSSSDEDNFEDSSVEEIKDEEEII